MDFRSDPTLNQYLADNFGNRYIEAGQLDLPVTWGRWCAKDGTNLHSRETGVPFFGQAGQDLFVLYCLQQKRHGCFLEIGSNDPVFINNTFLLERGYDWKGLMIEYLNEFTSSYRRIRPGSDFLIGDALAIDYAGEFARLNYPADMDYLQIDLEWAGSLRALQRLDQQLLSSYRFAVITFEHDFKNIAARSESRLRSREILNRRGYEPVFLDVMDVANRPYEDWYVHPALVNREIIERVRSLTPLTWKQIVSRLLDHWPSC